MHVFTLALFEICGTYYYACSLNFLGGIEVLVCPGLAFGQNCSRLGRGKGYYDKYIETCKQKGSYPFMVGLAFNEQVTKGDLALDENDQYLSVVLYPSMHRYELPSGLKEGKTFIERNLFYTFPYWFMLWSAWFKYLLCINSINEKCFIYINVIFDQTSFLKYFLTKWGYCF